MPQMVSYGDELIRINYSNNHIEFSHNNGRTWMRRSSNVTQGTFRDLLVYEGSLFACTDKGVFESTNDGVSWQRKSSSDASKSLETLQDGGDELLGISEDGTLYFSHNSGVTWIKRR